MSQTESAHDPASPLVAEFIGGPLCGDRMQLPHWDGELVMRATGQHGNLDAPAFRYRIDYRRSRDGVFYARLQEQL